MGVRVYGLDPKPVEGFKSLVGDKGLGLRVEFAFQARFGATLNP